MEPQATEEIVTEMAKQVMPDSLLHANWMIMIILILFAIAGFFAVYSSLKAFYYRRKLIRYKNNFEINRISEFVLRNIYEDHHIKSYIESICKEYMATKICNPPASETGISKTMSDKPETVASVTINPSNHIFSEIPNPAAHQVVQAQRMYATSYNANEQKFYEVEPHFSDKSIFSIETDPGNPLTGVFEVCREVHKKVQGCRDFLEGCCEVEGYGFNLKTIEKGEVELKGNEWVVTKKLRIKFY